MTTANKSSGGGGCMFVLMNLLALVFIGIGGWYGYGSWRLVQGGHTVTGTVVDIDESTDEDGTSYAPIIEYRVGDENYRMTGIYNSQSPYDIGDQVELRYDRADPAVARVDSFVDLWLLPAIFLPLGLLFFLIFNAIVVFGWFNRLRQRSVAL